jgi:chromate transporter
MSDPRPTGPAHGVPFAEALAVWARIGLLSFGGPAGQIAVMHRIIVDEKRWIGERRFLGALNYCMLLPGPEATQLAIYVGWLMHGLRGGLAAGILFLLPGFVTLLALSLAYLAFGATPLIEGLFFGLKAGVLAIVLQAVVRLGGRALGTGGLAAIAAASFVAIFAFDVPFPLIVLGAGLAGFLAGRAGSRLVEAAGHGPNGPRGLDDRDALLGEATPAHAQVDRGWLLRMGAAGLALWLVPVGLIVLALGATNVFAEIAAFFSKMAVVTFGGAYAVLAYVAQQAVEHYGWLQPGEMLDGLGMAEATPGPLIQVVQFVGFLGAVREPGGLDPVLAGTLAAVLTTWVTFVPSFLFIFLGAPFAERLRGNVALAGALAAITAAVVGVILNLALWFGLHVLFRELRPGPLALEVPVWRSLDLAAAALVLAALVAVFRFRLGVLTVLGGAAAAGIAWTLATA